MVSADLSALDLPTLNTMLAQQQAILTGIAGAGQSYSLNNRMYRAPDMPQIMQAIENIAWAIQRKTGNYPKVVAARLSPLNRCATGTF